MLHLSKSIKLCSFLIIIFFMLSPFLGGVSSTIDFDRKNQKTFLICSLNSTENTKNIYSLNQRISDGGGEGHIVIAIIR